MPYDQVGAAMSKTFVTVLAQHDTEGNVMPVKFIWPNNKQYDIDRILDVRMAASLKGGGQGVRYTCKAMGREIYMFLDDGKWFIET